MSPADAPSHTPTVGGAVGEATARLRTAGSPSPRLDAEVLAACAVGRDRAWLLAHLDDPLPDAAGSALAAWVERRAAGEPIAYIRGFKEWYGLRIRTDGRALIPRPETELLVQEAAAEIAARLGATHRTILVRDVGTGSGAVAVALARRFRTALELGRVSMTASDIAQEALELARENLADHGVDALVRLVAADLLDPTTGAGEPVDVVVANLPYVTHDEVSRGEGSLAWEPASALDGGHDGLDLIRRLLPQLADGLAPDGVALLEVGAGQARAVGELSTTLPGCWSVAMRRDLAGHERVVILGRTP